MPGCHRPSGSRLAHLVAIATMALAGHVAGVAAQARAGMPDSEPVVGAIDEICYFTSLGLIPGEPFSALALPGGGLLLVMWDRGGTERGAGKLFWLGPEGLTLNEVASDVPPGRIAGAVRLLDGRVLITAAEGLFRLDPDRGLKRILDCDQIGRARLFQRTDGEALTFPNGDLVIEGEQGLLRLSPQDGLVSIGAVVPMTETLQILSDDTLLLSGVFGHHLLSRDGIATPVATGALANATLAGPDPKRALRSAPSDFAMIAPELGPVRPVPPQGLARMDASGATQWAALPADVTLASPFELEDGRLFLLTDRGLLRMRDDGTTQQVTAAVRLGCADTEKAKISLIETLADGRSLILAYPGLFTIDRTNRVTVIAGPYACSDWVSEQLKIAVTADGWIYFVRDDVLYGADRRGRVTRIAGKAETDEIDSLHVHGADLLVETSDGLLHLRGGGSLRRVLPTGQDADLLRQTDLDGRPLICVDKSALHRLDNEGNLQPLPALAGIPCGGFMLRIGSVGLLLQTRDRRHVLITRDHRAIIIPGARVWPVAALQDDAVVLLTLPAAREDAGYSLDPDESARAPHALIRVSTEGRIDPITLEGPEFDLKPPALLSWPERREIGAIHFSSPTRGWAIFGERGALAQTVDGGVQWRAVRPDGLLLEGLESISFTSDGRRGLAAGKEALWRTDDAGATWKRISWPDAIFSVAQVVLADPEGVRAYVIAERVGENRITADLLVSSDGGLHWQQPALPLPATVAHPVAAMGFDAAGQGGWLVAGDRLLTTRDGGSTWQVLADLRDFRDVETLRWRFEMPQLTSLAGFRMANLRTMPLSIASWPGEDAWCMARGKLFCIAPEGLDGYLTSREIETGADVAIAAVAGAPAARRGWAVGSQGTILATEDGGQTWAAQQSGVRGSIIGLFFLPDALHGWAWGEDGMLVTRDGGKRWQPVKGR
jgi:photosystem II stability/assembly factor-like uncharacterized protein